MAENLTKPRWRLHTSTLIVLASGSLLPIVVATSTLLEKADQVTPVAESWWILCLYATAVVAAAFGCEWWMRKRRS